MSKTKATKVAKGADKTEKALTKVKDAGVTKASQTPKAKGKEIARKLAAKEEKSSRKNKKKAPSPSSSDSESDSDEEMKSASSSSESESESEDEKPAKKETKKATKPAESSSESESESESEESSSEEEAPKKTETKKAEPKKAEAKKESSDSESESESESDSDSDSSESEAKAPAKAKKAEPAKKAKKDASSSESEESDSSEKSGSDSESGSDSDSDSDSEETEDSAKESPKKRKADEQEAPAAKKSKTQEEIPGASANLFVGNLSWNVDEEWLRSEFDGFGELSGVRIVTERDTGRSRGFGYVEFTNVADAVKAYEAKKGAEVDGRKINLDYANARPANNNEGGQRDRAQARARSFGDQTSPESDTLFIGNLPFSASEDAINETFAEKGSILGIRLPTDPESGRPKGFGYIQFSSVDEARAALNDL
ncbi:nucleolin protein Nsr1, partial [Paecilomyces variotii No. 5]